jgi:hypothetical protein
VAHFASLVRSCPRASPPDPLHTHSNDSPLLKCIQANRSTFVWLGRSPRPRFQGGGFAPGHPARSLAQRASPQQLSGTLRYVREGLPRRSASARRRAHFALLVRSCPRGGFAPGPLHTHSLYAPPPEDHPGASRSVRVAHFASLVRSCPRGLRPRTPSALPGCARSAKPCGGSAKAPPVRECAALLSPEAGEITAPTERRSSPGNRSRSRQATDRRRRRRAGKRR